MTWPALLLSLASRASVPQPPPPPPDGVRPALAALDDGVAAWPPRPRLAARQLALRYGPPAEVTEEAVVWRDVGVFTRITVRRDEVPHDFPRPHTDFVEHTIAYRVPAGRHDALSAFDGSLVIDRTTGELSSRCDSEARNVLALNLAHDVVTGAATPDAAREAFGQNHLDDVLGLAPAYTTALRFEPATIVADPDVPVIPGSPVRPGVETAGDSEVLGWLVALDDREIAAAEAVEDRFDVDPAVRAYATMLHEEHGRSLVDTLALGETIGARPHETPAVDGFRQEGAGALAELLVLTGDAFGEAFVRATIEDHAGALERLDRYAATVASGPLRNHLIEARGHALAHLEAGRSLLETERTTRLRN